MKNIESFTFDVVGLLKLTRSVFLGGGIRNNHTRKGAKSQCGGSDPAAPAGKGRRCHNKTVKSYRGQ